jgi:hypothetical protein
VVERFVLRVWLPDRPGALGQVASRIGALHGDVVGIEILEQGGGRAVDELVVELPGAGLEALLAREVGEVEGVDVEWIQPLGQAGHDPQLALLEAAARLVAIADEPVRLERLCTDLAEAFEAGWAAVVDLASSCTEAAVGDAPSASWLSAFVHGSRHLDDGDGHGGSGAEDVAWAEVPGRDHAVVVGRTGRPFRARERRQLGVLARISGALGETLDGRAG